MARILPALTFTGFGNFEPGVLSVRLPALAFRGAGRPINRLPALVFSGVGYTGRVGSGRFVLPSLTFAGVGHGSLFRLPALRFTGAGTSAAVPGVLSVVLPSLVMRGAGY